jgi:hypothetical protein
LVGAHAGLIEKENLRALPLGPGAQTREDLGRPALDRHGVAFVRAPQRFLRGDVQRGEQPPDGCHAQAYAKLLLDQRGDDLPRPQPTVETVLPRVLAIDPPAYLELLLGRQGRRRPRMCARLEGRLPTAPLRLQPLVDRGATQPVALDHAARALAVLHAPNRQKAQRLGRFVGKGTTINRHDRTL